VTGRVVNHVQLSLEIAARFSDRSRISYPMSHALLPLSK
jgi:hypothetical protein